jgi:hypothetical protein
MCVTKGLNFNQRCWNIDTSAGSWGFLVHSSFIDKHWLNIEQTYFISTEYVPLSPRYNWHIVKSGVKHHNPKPVPSRSVDLYDGYQISIFKNLLR